MNYNDKVKNAPENQFQGQILNTQTECMFAQQSQEAQYIQ